MGALAMVGRVVAGCTVGLLLAEAAFYLRDDGAFPHVNVYTSDVALGARLRPLAEQRIAFGGNATTTFRTNELGYRAPSWPASADDEVLVVGDSQVFGLGVEDDQTASARLGEISGRSVLNGGVPTYGPDEYLAVVDEVLASGRDVSTVVWVFNFSNDMFELKRPNVTRHAVWDGWAVRAETAPEEVTWFPGRGWLMGRSHLVYAARRWLYDVEPVSLPSEGGLVDVVGLADAWQPPAQGREEAIQEQIRAQADQYLAAASALGDDQQLMQAFEMLAEHRRRDEDLILRAAFRGAHPGDIVRDGYAESTRRIVVTAEILREGAAIRRTLRQRLEAALREEGDAWWAEDVRRALAARRHLDPDLVDEEIDVASWGTPFDDMLSALQDRAARHNLDVVVVALPLDVQVSEAQWAKYGEEPQDMSGTESLLAELVEGARRRGMRGVNLLPVLREAGDEAFLSGDLHLSPRGQQVVAEALHAALQAPAPAPQPRPGLPEGRSRVPHVQEWEASRENLVRGSTRNRCQTRQIREWLRLDCRDEEESGVEAVDLSAAAAEAFGVFERGGVVLWTPVHDGRDTAMTVRWSDHTEVLHVRGSQSPATFEFVATDDAAVEVPPVREGPVVPAFLHAEPWALRPRGRARWFGEQTLPCLDVYTDRKDQVACLVGTRTHPPTCPEGRVNAGSAGHCLALCDTEAPCVRGVCAPWQGVKVCL
jgi:hypothetical protein